MYQLNTSPRSVRDGEGDCSVSVLKKDSKEEEAEREKTCRSECLDSTGGTVKGKYSADGALPKNCRLIFNANEQQCLTSGPKSRSFLTQTLDVTYCFILQDFF